MTDEQIKIGVEELKDVINFLCKLTTAIDKVTEDHKVSLTDLPHLSSPLIALLPAISGLSNVPKEIANLAETEVAELKELVKIELELRDDKAEEVSEQVVGIALQLAKTLLAVKEAKS